MADYEYIVVGAGSAGGTLAARLTENASTRVLLLEAGAASHPYSRMPLSFGLLIDNPAANWLYQSEPEPGTANRQIPVPRGKLLGGSSSINGLVWVRGQPLDYDTWAQLGCRGWSWRDVAPVFTRIENFVDGDGANGRGTEGPLKVSTVPDQIALAPGYLDSVAGYLALYEKWIDRIGATAGHAKNLVQQILTFSRMEEGKRVPARLQPAVRAALELMRTTMPSMMRIEADIRSGKFEVPRGKF